MTEPAHKFDEAYYRRWYGDARTRAFTKADKDIRAGFVVSYMKLLKMPLRSVVDVGCGLGHWREALLKLKPGLSYTGVEYSAIMAKRFGWVESSAADYAPRRQFDLVISQAVLQHMDDADCARAIDNMGAYARGALYLEVLTREDWSSGMIDKKYTEKHAYLRSRAWYVKRLGKYFTQAGGGLFVAKSAGVSLLDMERGF